MKFLILGLTAASLLVFLWSCKSKKVAVDPLTQVGVIWGSGGGFTGKTTTFKLLETGEIYKTEGTQGATLMPMKPIKAKVAKAMFSAVRELNLAEVSQNTPGNMYNFVELNIDGKPHRITWGDAENAIPQKVKDFYTLLNQLVLKGTD
jgi:hypothetical protein